MHRFQKCLGHMHEGSANHAVARDYIGVVRFQKISQKKWSKICSPERKFPCIDTYVAGRQVSLVYSFSFYEQFSDMTNETRRRFVK